MEVAKARWARTVSGKKAAQQPQPKPKSQPSNSINPLVAKLDTKDFVRRAGSAVAVRGISYFSDKSRFKLEELTESSATVQVRGSQLYEVIFDLGADGEIVAACECPYEEYDVEIICKHKVAAAMFLKANYQTSKPSVTSKTDALVKTDYQIEPVKPEPSSLWRESLAGLLQSSVVPAKSSTSKAILFFSFIRRNHQFVLQPGVVMESAIPPELWPELQNDRAALSDYLIKNSYNFFGRVYPLQSYQANVYQIANASPELQALAFQVAGSSQSNYYDYRYDRYGYNTPPIQNSNFWPAMSNALVFRGDEQRLIKSPLTVLPGLAQVELEVQRDADGINLSPVLKLSNRTFKLNTPGLETFNTSPLWLKLGEEIFQAELELWKFDQLRKQKDVVIPPEETNEFFQRNFPQLATSYELTGDSLTGDTLTGQAPQPRIYLTEHDQQLRIFLRFAYGGLDCIAAKKPPSFSYVHDTETDLAVKIERQPEAESQWWTRLGTTEFGLKCGNLKEGLTQDTFLLRKIVHPFDFLKNQIPKLTAAGVEVFGEAELTLAKVNHSKPTISFNVTSGIDWFDVKAVINFGELEVSLAEIRKSLRKKERFIKLADGSIGEIPDEWLDKYKHLFGLSETKEDGFRVARHHLTLLDQLFNDNEQITADKKFEVEREWLKNFQGIAEQPLPTNFTGELRPYQKAGFDWLHFLREARFGGCLADDMGTGKTIQALCFLQSLKEQYEERNKRKRKKEPRAAHLLVVPRSLVTNWEREAEKFAPGLRILNFSNAERSADIKEFDDYDIVVTTYGILLREVERLVEYEFDTVILDEAQAIKNPVSESAKSVRLLKCRNRLTLTGTPVENNTFELWSQFAFLNPGLLGSADYFRQEFTNPIERQQNEDTTKSLRRLVYPFILRRTKDQVALDLPPRSEKILWNEMEPAQRKLYNLTRDEYRAKILKLIEDKGVKDARFRILEGLLRLRQICNHPKLVQPTYKGSSAKLDTLMENLETLGAEGHKALIFSQFVQMLKLIEASLKKAKIPYTYLDGSTINRQARVDTFQTDEKIKVFLISLKAGGVGLNLTAADYVIHVDPWWNPAVEMQATDRAHRIGQDKPVFVYKLMMRDSVEEKILQLQERKRTLVKQLISTEAGFFKSLTADDITALFS